MVLRRGQLVLPGLVRHPRHRVAAGIADGGAEVDRVRRVRKVLALHDEGPHVVAQVAGDHGLRVRPAPRGVARRHDRQPATAVLDEAAADPRQARLLGGGTRRVVLHHGVVVHVRDGTPLLGCRLSAGKCPTTIVWKCTMRCRPSEGCSRPESSSRRGVSMAPPATTTRPVAMVCVFPSASMYSTPVARAAVRQDPGHERLGHEMRPPGGHRLGEQRHRVALGVDGAAEEGAEPAVVAGGPAVVGDAVRRRRCLVRVQPDGLGGLRREQRAVHGGPRRHRVRARPPRGERVGPGAAGDPDGAFDLRVVRLELGVLERPVVDVARRVAGRAGCAAGSPLRGNAGPCRRRECRRRPRWSGWSSPRRRACARPRRRCAGTPAAR